jgi:predicted Zn-dependent peptidase
VSVYERAILSNGIRVVTAPMPHAHSVTCVVMIGAGSRYETAETRGIAHFAEHMFFKGTEKRPSPREISRVIDSIGGAQNAATNKEYTLYYVRCGAEQRDVALEWLVDILRNSKFDAGDIEREKGVVVEELNMYADTPRDIIDSIYEEHLYGENPLGWEILGTEETVRSADRERFLDYLGRWYTPDRIVVGVAGDVGEGLVETLEELLGDMHGEAAGAPAPATAAPSERPRVRVQHKASEQAHLCLGVLSKPIDHPDRYTLHLLATILGGGSSSRLFTEVREERGLAYYVNAYADSYTDTGTLYAQAGVDLARVDDAVETIARELKRIVEDPVADDELELGRNFAKGRFVLQTETPQGLIMFGLRREVLEGEAVDPEVLLAGLDAVTAEDLQRVAQETLGAQGLNLALIGPFEDPARFEALLA